MGGAVSIPADSGLPEDTQAALKALHADKGEDVAKAAYVDAMAAKDYFLVIDADGDGSIDKGELKTALRAIGKAAQMKTNSGMQVLELMKELSGGGGDGEAPITLTQWIAGLGQESSVGLRNALKAAYDPASKKIAGLLSVPENLARLDSEIANLEAQLTKLKKKRAKMVGMLKAEQVSPAEAAVAAAATDFVAEGC